jgi:hypothetical protein
MTDTPSTEEMLKELKLHETMYNFLVYAKREQYTPEMIGIELFKTAFSIHDVILRDKYEGITDSLVIKMFGDIAQHVATECLRFTKG